MSGGSGTPTTAPDDDEFQITYEKVELGQGVCVGMGHEKQIAELEARCVRAEEALRQIIDCPDFSAKRAFSMKMIARAALAAVPEENQGDDFSDDPQAHLQGRGAR